jgi:2-hydroxychromene-2-carboxylate isomerase
MQPFAGPFEGGITVIARITFYFDFVSPNSYIAAHGIDDIAAKHARAVDWRPVSLFQVWDTIDHHPLGKPKAKARYLVRDFKRSAAIAGLPLTMPKPFPLDADLARRAFYRIAARDPELARAFALAVFGRYWAEGEDISTPEQIAANTAALGVGADEMVAAADDEAAATAAMSATEEAIEAGAFGVPYMVVDGEPFWGQDRLGHLDWWLERQAAER